MVQFLGPRYLYANLVDRFDVAARDLGGLDRRRLQVPGDIATPNALLGRIRSRLVDT
jgi:hypothetical protein